MNCLHLNTGSLDAFTLKHMSINLFSNRAPGILAGHIATHINSSQSNWQLDVVIWLSSPQWRNGKSDVKSSEKQILSSISSFPFPACCDINTLLVTVLCPWRWRQLTRSWGKTVKEPSFMNNLIRQNHLASSRLLTYGRNGEKQVHILCFPWYKSLASTLIQYPSKKLGK